MQRVAAIDDAKRWKFIQVIWRNVNDIVHIDNGGVYMIRLENISKIYDAKIDTTKALDNVSLQINDGELVAIMGPSGSGKSTLLNILGCMDTATEGKYYVDDVEVSMLKNHSVTASEKEYRICLPAFCIDGLLYGI